MNLFRRRATRPTLELAFWLVVATGTMFLMSRASARVWELFPPLAFVQFPWRLLMVVALATAALSAHLVSIISDRRLQAAFVIGLAIVQVQLSYTYFGRAAISPGRRSTSIGRSGETQKRRRRARTSRWGYFPASLGDVPRNIARYTVIDGTANVTEVSHKGHELELDVVADAPVVLRINSPTFPGWLVTIDGRPADVDVAGGYPRVRCLPADIAFTPPSPTRR